MISINTVIKHTMQETKENESSSFSCGTLVNTIKISNMADVPLELESWHKKHKMKRQHNFPEHLTQLPSCVA